MPVFFSRNYCKVSGDAQRRAELVPEFGARRAPLQIKTELFRSLIGNQSINDYLDELFHRKAPPIFEKIVQSGEHGIILLFAASVAIAAEDWKSASSFAERALYFFEVERP